MAAKDDPEREDPEHEGSHMLQEGRMILPGVQALFGFQMVAFFTDRFTHLARGYQAAHMGATMLTIVAIALLLIPPAYHRQADPHRLTKKFLRLGSRCLTAGMFTLMLALSVQVFVIAALTFPDLPADFALAGGCLALLLVAWFVWPRLARLRDR